jgi:hypothetical protein
MAPTPLLGLRWAIKRSFLEYIARAPGGRGSLTDGAVATGNKEIVFAPAPPPALSETDVALAFRGTATFSAHSGALLVPIADPWAIIRETEGEITIVDPFQREGTARLKLASFGVAEHLVADGYEHWAATDVRLAPEACELFNNVYPAAAPLAPFTIIVPVNADN